MVERTAQEEKVDKTRALKELIHLGRRQLLLHRWLVRYRDGTCSLDKAASGARITVHEMMQEAAKAGIRSTQTLQEYRQGFKKLLGNKA
jgi:hypothetical protein